MLNFYYQMPLEIKGHICKMMDSSALVHYYKEAPNKEARRIALEELFSRNDPVAQHFISMFLTSQLSERKSDDVIMSLVERYLLKTEKATFLNRVIATCMKMVKEKREITVDNGAQYLLKSESVSDVLFNRLLRSESISTSIGKKLSLVMFLTLSADEQKQLIDRAESGISDASEHVSAPAIKALALFVNVKPELAEGVVDKVFAALTGTDFNVRMAALEALAEFVKIKPALLTERVFNKVLSMVTGHDSDGRRRIIVYEPITGMRDSHAHVCTAALNALACFVKVMPDYSEVVFDQILVALTNTNAHVRKAALDGLAEFVKVNPAFLTERVFNKVLSMITDKDEVYLVVIKTLAEFIKVKPDFDEFLFGEMLGALTEGVWYTQQSTVEVLGWFARVKLEPLFAPLFAIALDPVNGSPGVRAIALEALAEFVKVKPDFAELVFNKVCGALTDNSSLVRTAAIKALAELVKVRPEFLTQTVLSAAIALTENSDTYIRREALNALVCFVKVRPNLAGSLLPGMFIALTKPHMRYDVIRTLAKFLEVRPDLAERVFGKIWGSFAAFMLASYVMFELTENSPNVQKVALAALLATPAHLTQNLFAESLVVLANAQGDPNRRKMAIKAVALLIKLKPEWLTQAVYNNVCKAANHQSVTSETLAAFSSILGGNHAFKWETTCDSLLAHVIKLDAERRKAVQLEISASSSVANQVSTHVARIT